MLILQTIAIMCNLQGVPPSVQFGCQKAVIKCVSALDPNWAKASEALQTDYVTICMLLPETK
jgi:hypothetical protein